MMPELGKYTATVLLSYAGTLGPMIVLLGWSLWRGAKVKAALAAQEERMKKNG
ncbi:heme exporter protein CcmD [Thioclava sp. A2]|uniref:heme exporter protein CcmD n=1 Tax=Thioclava sp. FCG-A2 TaxID=3080562 RepID=UPI0029558875|nr:heme exporter protein CcmD [Thioclava sp. A2]MDV7269664.1 heme exporter protein CcmD [Thioclava sp. A2]